MVRQEWNKWNIDAFFPMNYNDFYLEDASWLAPIVKEEVASVQGKKPVYSGLFICEDWQNKGEYQGPGRPWTDPVRDRGGRKRFHGERSGRRGVVYAGQHDG